MITLLKVLLILSLSYFAAHGIIDRARHWGRVRGVRFIVEIIQCNGSIEINGRKERDNLFTSDEEEAILNYLVNTNQEILSLISSESEIKKLTKKFKKASQAEKIREINRKLKLDKKDKS